MSLKTQAHLRKPEIYQKVVELRRKGLSYNEILLEIRMVQERVSKGTISRWCQGITLTEEQKIRLKNKRNDNPFILELKEGAQKRKDIALSWADEQVKKIIKNEELLILSSMLLYWAEGTKLNEKYGRHEFTFTNTDKRMIAIMMKFLREILKIPEEKICIRVRIGSEGDLMAAKAFWSEVVKIPVERFKKPEILILTKNSKSLEKYPNGICRVSVYDILIARKTAFFIDKFCNLMLP